MKTLTSAQFDEFHDLGYLFPVRVMDGAKAGALRRRFEDFEAGDLVKQFAGREHELYRFKAHLLFTWVDEIVHNPRSLDIVEDIIGPNILVWTVGVFVKEPWSDYRVQWHQDSVHTGLDKPGHLMRGWHALTVSRRQNGTMRFSPRSHTLGDLPHISDSDTDGMKLRDAHVDYDVDEDRAVSVDLEPGEVAFFSSRTLHESGPNRSADRRVNVVVTYMPPEVRPASARESALLVRGVDNYGHWRPETRPLADLDPAAIAMHKAARAARVETYLED